MTNDTSEIGVLVGMLIVIIVPTILIIIVDTIKYVKRENESNKDITRHSSNTYSRDIRSSSHRSVPGIPSQYDGL